LKLIAYKYREGKTKRTLKRELKALEIAKGEAFVDAIAWVGFGLSGVDSVLFFFNFSLFGGPPFKLEFKVLKGIISDFRIRIDLWSILTFKVSGSYLWKGSSFEEGQKRDKKWISCFCPCQLQFRFF